MASEKNGNAVIIEIITEYIKNTAAQNKTGGTAGETK
jgi:hypothetical protein